MWQGGLWNSRNLFDKKGFGFIVIEIASQYEIETKLQFWISYSEFE